MQVPDSIGSGGGIKEVIAKRIDIARVARALKDTETHEGLVYILYKAIIPGEEKKSPHGSTWTTDL